MANPHKTTPAERAQERLRQFQEEGADLAAKGSPFGAYLAGMTERDMRNLHQARDDFDEMFEQALDAPQMITIEGRRGKPDHSVFLIPLDQAEALAVEVLAALQEEEGEPE